MTRKGQITIPKKMREVLQLAPGDSVQLELNDRGEVVMRKALGADSPPRRRALRPRVETQVRRRAAELLALLRGLD